MVYADDLIELDDVKQEGTITGTNLDTDIEYRIPKSIENIIYDELELETQSQIQELIDNRKKLISLKWAIIYHVLAWLENEGKITGKNMDVTSVKDSQVSISYSRRSKSEGNNAKSYSQLSKDYVLKLKPIKRVGGSPHGY